MKDVARSRQRVTRQQRVIAAKQMPAAPRRVDRRVGAVRIADIPPAILADLNAGRIESASLAESLAVDFATLLQHVAPRADADRLAAIRAERSITRRMPLAAAMLLDALGPDADTQLRAHRSDTVRGWAAYAIALRPRLGLATRLQRIRPLADDPNAGVREWAWLALRPHIASQIAHAIELLRSWTSEESPNLRRFASESTRPRGVWCAHIERLKNEPELGLPILAPLRADPARYVQNSVANWLNDAAKSQPAWVRGLCAEWSSRSATAATVYVCRRAQRSLAARPARKK